jgi:Flp pilus assembly protein TadD
MRGFFVVVCIFGACLSQAISGVLIVQEKVPTDRLGDPNVPVASGLAGLIEQEGLFSTVVWSYSDPIFRAAINDGHVKSAENVPSLEQAVEVARKLRLDHVIFVRAYQLGNNVMGRIQLYRGSKQIWKDPVKGTELLDPSKPPPINGVDKNGRPTQVVPKQETIKTDDRPMSIMGPEGLNVEDSATSLLRTWVAFMKAGPLKGQPVQPNIRTPDPLPGTRPITPDPIVVKVKPQVDNKQLLADLDAMIRAGQSVNAILILRDAVDAEPQDLERRMALVRTLLLVGQPELGAKEARRAAQLMPDKVELRAIAARAWMQAGREDEAMADLNEAVARDPNSRETRLLLAEVNLSKLRPQQAIEHLEAVLKEKPDANTWFNHALCQTLLGKKDQALSDLASAKDLGLPTGSQDVAVRYDATLDVMDKSLMQLGNDLRNLFSEAQVKRSDPTVRTAHETHQALASAWTSFLINSPAPSLHRNSHDRRLLALNLLVQSLSDLGAYLTTNDEGTFADARINMGEALKQFAAAQSSYKSEIGGTPKGVGT